MAITDNKIVSFAKIIADLADKPNATLSATQLKEYFDSSPEEIRVALNALIDDLLATTSSDSGAHNIGSETISGVNGNTVYAQLVDLKGIIDDVVLGDIPDDSLTNAKLDTDIKVGSLASLTTTDKSNVVSAVNENASNLSAHEASNVTEFQMTRIRSYMEV